MFIFSAIKFINFNMELQKIRKNSTRPVRNENHREREESMNEEDIIKAIRTAEDKLTTTQESVVKECLTKNKFGLSLNLGFGKTVCSLIVLLKKILRSHGKDKDGKNVYAPALAIVPKTIIASWEHEIKKFFDDTLKYQIITNSFQLDKDAMLVLSTPDAVRLNYTRYNIREIFVNHIVEQDELYENLQREINDYRYPTKPYNTGAFFYRTEWSSLIVDEAHKFTNIHSKRCEAICAIYAKNRWLISGTLFDEPKIERLFGYYAMLNWPTSHFPANMPDAKLFIKSADFLGTNATLVTRPFPTGIEGVEVIRTVVQYELRPEEALIYTNMKEVLNVLEKRLKMFKAEGDTDNVRKFVAYILTMILYLRQSIVVPILPIANITLDMSDLGTKKSELSVILMDKFNKLKITDYLNNKTSACSSRLNQILKTIHSHNKATDKIVVFSSFRTTLDLLRHFAEPLIEHMFCMESTMSTEKRGKLVRDFTECKRNCIFFATYEIGAEGLNLQCANVVIIMDFWWNAGKTKQSVGRVIRNGQKSAKVHVYFYSSNTGMEKALFDKHQDKEICLNEMKTGAMTSKIRKLNMEDLIKLVNYEDSKGNVEYLERRY